MTWRVFTDPGYIIGSGIRPGLIQRIFITLDPVLESHYTIQNPVVETGDFRHSYLIASTNLTSDMALMDADITASGAEGDVLLFIDSTDGLEFLVGDSGTGFTRTIFGGHASILDGKFNEIVLERTSGVVRALLNGVQLGGTVNESRILTFGGKFGGGFSRFFEGVIANIDLGNGNAWKINRATGNTEQSSSGNNILTYNNAPASIRELFTLINGEWELSNSITNGDFSNGTVGWAAGFNGQISESGGELSITDTGSGFGRTVTPSEFVAGLTYRVVIGKLSTDAGIARVAASGSEGTGEDVIINTTTSVDIIYNPSVNNTHLTIINQDATTGKITIIDDVSVKRIIKVA